MFLRKRAQSTAEYAITIGIVVAVVAGVMQVALKGGMRKKGVEATNFLNKAGTADSGATLSTDTATFGANPMDSEANDFNTYESEARQTKVASDDYIDRKIQHKGGGVTATQQQTSSTTSLTVESYGKVHDGDQP